MKPSEFFALLPEVKPEVLGLTEHPDGNARAAALVNGLVRAALVDFAELTGTPATLATPPLPEHVREFEAFTILLGAAALRLKARMTALEVANLYNPDVPGGLNLDLVKVIGRAARGELQRARRLLKPNWLEVLAGAEPRGR